MLAALLLAQAAPADISLHATLEARSVKIERKGQATITARAEPDGGSVAGSSGSTSSRRFELRIDARIADRIISQAPEQRATGVAEQR